LTLDELLSQVRACAACDLPHGPRPVLSVHADSRILIIGQAPGSQVHASGVPWDDDSGVRLRQWLGVSNQTFYDPRAVGILPMGFCYPGKGKSGDLPPRRECAPLWHDRLLAHLGRVELSLLVGQYAQKQVLGKRRQRNLTETVRAWRDYGPALLPLPHPSWRVRRWMGQQPWFEDEVVPALQGRVMALLGA